MGPKQTYMGLRLSYMGLKLSYMGLKMSYMGLKLTYMWLKITHMGPKSINQALEFTFRTTASQTDPIDWPNRLTYKPWRSETMKPSRA